VSGRHVIAWRYWHYQAHLKHIQEWILQRWNDGINLLDIPDDAVLSWRHLLHHIW
jgi:hypothetical protein